MSLVSAFNKLLDIFNNELIKTFPEENKFKTLKRAISTINKFNHKKSLELFKKYIKNCREQITSRNDNYFMKKDYTKDIISSPELNDNPDNAFELVDRLKHYWSELSDNNKTVIWDYLNSLIKLSDRIQ